ncbi:MAG: Na(+)-translocating NADH-quinone reductase subunit C [Melioribacteraceae bacterium]
MSHDSTKKTVLVAAGVCFVCAILVSSATVSLAPKQAVNKKLDRVQNILAAGDVKTNNEDPQKIYAEKIKPIIIEVESGRILDKSEYTAELNPEKFDIKKMVNIPEYTYQIPSTEDAAGIKKRPKYMAIYEVMGENNEVEKYIFPIYGKGLWSTLYGFISLDKDLKVVKGLTFYEHGETPGLGGEVDNPKWKETWKGKKAFDDDGKVIIQVIKGKVDYSSPQADHQIDGLSGSTLTTRGVDNLVRYWLSENGYAPFLKSMRKTGDHEKI